MGKRGPNRAPKGWMTRPQAAKYLGISQVRMGQLTEEYNIPMERAIKGGFMIYRIEDVEHLFQQRNK